MTRTSIFNTQRPDLGTLIKFDTPGQNETQLDEDLFEKEIVEFFQSKRYLSNKRIMKITMGNLGSGEIAAYFNAVSRGFKLMDQLPSKKYFKTHLGYVKNNC